jgi:hypothetical protein
MFLQDFVDEYAKYRAIGDKALAQVSDEGLNKILSPNGNSIAMIVRHVGGNFVSRFTGFLTSDGEKPSRDRDAEFSEGPFTRAEVDAAWLAGWKAVDTALDDLSEDDLQMPVKIRGIELSVHEALCRSLAHSASHVGQIVLLARIVATDDWKWISIPKGQSRQYNLNPTMEKLPSR